MTDQTDQRVAYPGHFGQTNGAVFGALAPNDEQTQPE